MSAAVWLGVAVLGGAGAVLRVVVTHAVARSERVPLAAGTLVVNLTGAFALGLLVASDAGHDVRLLLGTALLGAYTTFSTWMVEIEALRPLRRAAMYAVLTFALGLAFAALGRYLG